MGLHQRYEEILAAAHHPLTLDKAVEDGIRKKLTEAFDGMMSALFEEKGAALDINILATDKVQHFIETHSSALDSSFDKVEMSEGMRKRLQRSNYIFSGMKTFHELNEAFPSLLDENGNRKTFERFLNDVQKIDSTYNRNYLRAEYNFVQQSAEMASKWEDYAEDGDRYNLQYRTAGDDKVRPEHAALNGVTLPFSDPFWEEYYPPNGWNCRCTVVQVRKSKYPETPRDEAMARGEEALQKDSKGIFHFNAGKEKKSVPDYNPYTIKRCRDCDIAQGKTTLAFIPENELCAACRLIRQCENANKPGAKLRITEEEYKRILGKPLDQQYSEVTNGKKGIVKQHELVCVSAGDYPRVLSVAKAIANEIGDCFMSPEIPRFYQEGRRKVYKNLPEDSNANPDLIVPALGYVDVKSPEKVMNCCRNANHASSHQHAYACLTDHCFKKPITEKQVNDRNKAIWDSPDYHHDIIFWYIGGTLKTYKRPKE